MRLLSHQQPSIRHRKKKTVFLLYEQLDEPITDLKTKFEVEFYFYILDVTISSLEERFQQIHNHCDTFKFFYICNLKNMTKDDVMKNCKL